MISSVEVYKCGYGKVTSWPLKGHVLHFAHFISIESWLGRVPGSSAIWIFSPFIYRTCTSKFIHNRLTEAEQIQRKDLGGYWNHFQKAEPVGWRSSAGQVRAGRPHMVLTCKSNTGPRSEGHLVWGYMRGPHGGAQRELKKSFNKRLSDMIYWAGLHWASLTEHSEFELSTLADVSITQQRRRVIGTS